MYTEIGFVARGRWTMKLHPVRRYLGADYPTLAEYFAKREKVWMAPALRLAIALAMLAALVSGCDQGSIS